MATGSIFKMHVHPQRGAPASQAPRVAATDPRLNNRSQRPSVNTGQSSLSYQTPTPCPTPNSSHSVAQPIVQSPVLSTVAQARNASSSETDDFGSTLAKFIESHTALNVKRQEKEDLEKQTASRRKFFGYTETKQGTSNTPMMLHMFQAYKETDDLELRKVNKALSQHAETSRQFTDALQQSRLPPPVEGDSIAKLRTELKSEIDSLKQSTCSKSQAPAAFEENFEKLSASVNTQSQNHRSLQASLGDLMQWKEDIEAGNAKFALSALPMDVESIQRHLNSTSEKCQKAETDIKKLQQDCSTVKTLAENVKSELNAHDFKNSMNEMQASLSEFQSTVGRLSRIDKYVKGLSKDLESNMESSVKRLDNQLRDALNTQNSELKRLEQKLNGLHTGSDALATVPATGTELVANGPAVKPSAANIPAVNSPVVGSPAPTISAASASNTGPSQAESLIEQRMTAFEQAITELRDGNKKLESTYRDLYTGVSPVVEKGAGWVDIVEQCIQTTQVLTTSHRSLENRYNNINTEPMVRKMVHAIQEMYPSVSTLIEQIRALQEARKTQLSEVASLKAQMRELNPDARRAQLEQTFSERITSLKHEMTGQYTQCENRHSEQMKSALGAMARQWQNFESRLQSLPDSFANSPGEQISNQTKSLEEVQQAQRTQVGQLSEHTGSLQGAHDCSSKEHISDQINSLQEAQETQRKIFERQMSERITFLERARHGLSPQYISDQIKSLQGDQETQRERFEQHLSIRIHALQEVQKRESSINAKNLEEINILRGRFDIQQNAVENLGELGEKYAEDIASLNEQVQPLEDLQAKILVFTSELQGQSQRLNGLESPVRELKKRLDGIFAPQLELQAKALGFTSELQAQIQRIDGLESNVLDFAPQRKEQSQRIAGLQSKALALESRLRDQSQRIDGLESPIRTFNTRLDELQAFGSTDEIKAFCDQLRILKQEDIVSKITKLNDILSERIRSYEAEMDGGRASTRGNHEPRPGSSRPIPAAPTPSKPATPKPATSTPAAPKSTTAKPSDSTPAPPASAPPPKGAAQFEKSANPTPISNAPPLPPQNSPRRPMHLPTDNSSSETPVMPRAQAGEKRKRLSPSGSDRPCRQVSTPSQISSPALSGTDQSSRKKRKAEAQKKKERRRQSQLHQ